MKKDNFALIRVFKLSSTSLIPGISKWKKELIFAGVVHPAKNLCQLTEGGTIPSLNFTEILKPQRCFNISRNYFKSNNIKKRDIWN